MSKPRCEMALPNNPCHKPPVYKVEDDKSNGLLCADHAKDYVWLWLSGDAKRLGNLTLSMAEDEEGQ